MNSANGQKCEKRRTARGEVSETKAHERKKYNDQKRESQREAFKMEAEGEKNK